MKAISIRQPWAWLILNAGKDIENRRWPTLHRGPFLIHAAGSMTYEEYGDCRAFLDANPVLRSIQLPPPSELQKGGFIGSALLLGCFRNSSSPWFVGPYGFKIDECFPIPFMAYKGRLGFFEAPIVPLI